MAVLTTLGCEFRAWPQTARDRLSPARRLAEFCTWNQSNPFFSKTLSNETFPSDSMHKSSRSSPDTLQKVFPLRVSSHNQIKAFFDFDFCYCFSRLGFGLLVILSPSSHICSIWFPSLRTLTWIEVGCGDDNAFSTTWAKGVVGVPICSKRSLVHIYRQKKKKKKVVLRMLWMCSSWEALTIPMGHCLPWFHKCARIISFFLPLFFLL